MPNPSDEIKSKLDIVEVIREYAPLKAAGYNFRALCPFHREKTPSFMVSPEKQIWHCFGCGKGGDIFSFVMEMEGLSFVEALRFLAKKAGVVLKRADPALAAKRNILLDIMESAAKFYRKTLLDNPAAQAARAYLQERALTEETIEAWQLGYSLDSWGSLTNYLKGKSFGENEIFLAGLSVRKEKTSGFYDRFRDRVMFPINDINGDVVGFSARLLPQREAKERMGKYINTPSTMIYDKSKILFGLDRAKMAIKAEDAAVLVEGQMDCLTAHQAGFKNVIASSGTALTAEQVSLIKRYTNNLYLSFDMDKAGDLAAERGIAQAQAAEMQIKVIEVKDAKDPDECIKNNPDAWRRAVMNAKPMMQYYFDKTFAKFNKDNYESQRQSKNILLPVIAKFGSKIEQGFWLKKLSQEIDAKENDLAEELDKLVKKQAVSSAKTAGAAAVIMKPGQDESPAIDLKPSREVRLSELLLALGLRYPSHLEYIINHLGPEDLVGDDCRLFYRNLIIYYNKLIDFWTHEGGGFVLAINYQGFKDWLDNPENLQPDSQDYNNSISRQEENYHCASLLDKLVLLADKDFYDYTEEQAKAEIINLVVALRNNYLDKRRRELVKLIAAGEKENLEPAVKAEKLRELMEEYKAATEERKMINLDR
jgi:DNA primase